MDKINIVNPSGCTWSVLLYHVQTCTHARCLLRHWLVASSKIDCSRPHQTSMSRRFNSSIFVCGRHDAAWQPRSRTPQYWDLGCLEATGWRKKLLLTHFLTQQFNCYTCAARCAGALFCCNTKSLSDTPRIAGSSMTSLWRREAPLKMSVRDVTRISCFVTTMKLPHVWDLFNSFYDTIR